MPRVYEIEYAGHPLRYVFRFADTRFRFRPLPRPAEGECWDLCLDREWMERIRTLVPENSEESYVEYRGLIEPTAHALLKWDCCIYHAAAFLWMGRAWLLTGPSGTGKTTQFLNWRRLHPEEIRMISGDMPVLERKDGAVRVHPSPWNGKEKLRGDRSAPLGGIILLEQGSANEISRPPVRELLVPLMRQFMLRPGTEEDALKMTGLMDAMLGTAPAWKLVNRGDGASTELLRATLLESLEDETEGRHGTV